MTTELEQVFQTVDRLNDAELELLRRRIERSRSPKSLTHSRGYPEEAGELFAIPFDTYRVMSQDERDAVAFRAYKILDRWIDEELKKRHAKWMLVCGGEILESSPKFIEYPSSEKLIAVGQQRGMIPFVFIRTPLIEESRWSDLPELDYYPTLSKECGVVLVRNWRQSPLCFVNSVREALAGRNLLLEFPLKIELDGEKKTTKVIGKKSAGKKSKKSK
jgi:hypothetical protein